ncbi:LPS assembly lipoprotein LptE [Bartonella doshiae]|uniref:Predicted secreted (Periplasmic) protein (DUF2159) n=2 Tax=Bartonella doshiae TaxID=33044 RepID=A0A380ZFM0_BARDO|nr:LPS assembly lipoprotein LptE [Bartonella doshiae]EJF80518.1 hypothetical protein MCS_01168 [Bartonella doshiae NCTC 12862 = ATCC 700133]MBB6158828.1 LPS-assembly lipoprotein [Bartonella doshiae]SUV45747.1 Predicted secreted (periplasmic) protein (DUF2159) [Bartonella doshiae]
MSFFKSFILIILAGLCTFLSGCRIEPLYHEMSQISMTIDSASYGDAVSDGQLAGKNSVGLTAKLASIIIEEPVDRFGQMVRNHLLFLLNGKGIKPSAPAYQLALETSVMTRNSVHIEMGHESKRIRPTMGTVVGEASYRLRDMKNVPIAQGMGTIRASFERLHQEYATLQAEEDAKKRVAEELAEQIFMLISEDLVKH